MEERFERLEERNSQLADEVNLLRAELRDVRGNVSVARQSLGSLWRQNVDDWYGPPVRPVERQTSPGLAPASLPAGGTTPRPSPRTVSRSDGEASITEPLPAPVARRPLSPLPNVTPRAAADMNAAASRNLFTPSFGSHQSFADWAFTRLSTTSTTSAAGLDEVISGLRSVVVHLAAGLDTMERRNEVSVQGILEL
jgi:hypothetical protein